MSLPNFNNKNILNQSNSEFTENKSNILAKSNYNGIIITVLTALYILLIFKLASILTSG